MTKPLPTVDMFEVTRLTRAGRLTEAMAMLRGTDPAAAPAGAEAPADGPRTLDLTPPDGDDAVWTLSGATARRAAGLAEKSLPEGMKAWRDRLPPALGDGDADRYGPAVAPGARFETRTFTNEAGSRAYRLYVPSRFRGAPLPLIVMLHGCTQSPDDFAAGTRMNEVAEEHGILVAYPAQSKSANASKCWNWFNGADQQRDRGEPSLIAGITREILAAFPVPAGRVYVAGLSAGGAAAAVMGETYPDLFAAVGVHSGLACGAASDVASAFGAMRGGASGGSPRRASGKGLPTIVFHGDRDSTVNPVNADQVIAQAQAEAALPTTVSQGTTPAGMRFTRKVATDAAGRAVLEQWTLHGAGHAWSGGSPAGSYTDPNGPDASREMARFFLQAAPGA
ncbi:alpha/beta hydrolase family esterase [Aquabacter spiritensis]|uniref:Poly(Hydroxyalkanoate) depolymerase family esterase n=1 Tax=Aquabacter spiritensis TaxID=933073 RepID=A0A4V2UY08_9HYPH|nr:PHB depolymerase family esterase [Aquabacter spiritensis]TCT05488.1 poly(hydroxyalkanoate) depolymerase family esterase [Aquabacter spiritensis]